MSGEMEEADTGGETDRDEEDRDTEGERSIEGEREMRERGEEEPGQIRKPSSVISVKK